MHHFKANIPRKKNPTPARSSRPSATRLSARILIRTLHPEMKFPATAQNFNNRVVHAAERLTLTVCNRARRRRPAE